MIKLYDFPLSGHAHRVRLMLSLLNIEYQLVHVQLDQAEHKQADFIKLNPFQLVPVLDDNGFIVRDSVAILCYLASRYDPKWFPNDAKSVARIQEWLVFATKDLSAGPASARLVNVFGADLDHEKIIEQSHQLLKIVDQHLEGRDWLALEQVSIADIAAYTYIAHAPEGDVDLSSYANIKRWLEKIEALPNFVAMEKTLVGLAG